MCVFRRAEVNDWHPPPRPLASKGRIGNPRVAWGCLRSLAVAWIAWGRLGSLGVLAHELGGRGATITHRRLPRSNFSLEGREVRPQGVGGGMLGILGLRKGTQTAVATTERAATPTSGVRGRRPTQGPGPPLRRAAGAVGAEGEEGVLGCSAGSEGVVSAHFFFWLSISSL